MTIELNSPAEYRFETEYEISHPDYLESIGDKVLLIWSTYPYWIVINAEGLHIIDQINQGKTLDKVLEEYNNETEARKKILAFFEPFLRSGIMYPKGDPPRIFGFDESYFEKNVKVSNLTINATNACNLRCITCYNRSPRTFSDEMSPDEIKCLLEDARSLMNPKRMLGGLLGGEPLLRKQLVIETMSYAKQLGYSTGVSTNGILVDNEFAKEARNIDLTVQVSLDGASEVTNDAIRGSGTFKKAIRAVKILLAEEVRTSINMCYHRMNIGELAKFIQMGKELGVDSVRFIPLKMSGRAKDNRIEPVHFDEMIDVIYPILRHNKDLQRLCRNSVIAIRAALVRLRPKYKYCGVGLSTILVDSNGDVYSCPTTMYPDFRVGNIRDKPLSFIWREADRLKCLRKINIDTLNSKCASCVVRYLCAGGCRGESWISTGRLDQPAIQCEAIKNSAIRLMWILADEPDFFQTMAEELRQSVQENLIFDYNSCS